MELAAFVEQTYISSAMQKKNEWMRYVCRTQRCGVGLKLRVLERKTGRETREGEGRGGEERGEVECSVNMQTQQTGVYTVRTCTCMDKHSHMYTRALAHTHEHIHTHTNTHTHTHTNTHTHIQVYSAVRPKCLPLLHTD